MAFQLIPRESAPPPNPGKTGKRMSIFLQLHLDFHEYGNRDELRNFSSTIFTLLDEYENKTQNIMSMIFFFNLPIKNFES